MQLAKKRDTMDGIDEGAGDEECMINLVRHRFKNANGELCKALGTAVSFRMRRFRHRKRLYDQRAKMLERKKAVRDPASLKPTFTQPARSQIEQPKAETNKRSTRCSGDNSQQSLRSCFKGTMTCRKNPCRISNSPKWSKSWIKSPSVFL